MKRIYRYILLSVFAFAAVGCMNEELYPENPSAESGDEVQFGLMLGNPDTKTVYGVETGKVFPIYWVNGDKVQIYSPQCLDGRKSAEYQISVSGTSQDYADALTKTGSYGIQWGKETEVDFYSLYPSGSYTLSSTGGVAMADNVVINHKQNISVNGSVVKSDMEDCLMYAHTAVDRDQTNTVNLTYTPISSVVYVTLKVEDTATGTEDTDYTIQSVKLLAYDKEDPELPQPIAGTFSLNLADGTFVRFKDGASYSEVIADIVDASTGGYHVLRRGDSVSLPLFFAPVSNLNVLNWKIQVIANNKTFTKTLNVDKVIKPGQIHKITLPEFALNKAEWKEDTWMQNIPRNVYLSEISIPGSWNSLNKDFQGTGTDLQTQYNNGVRAFHLDCRWSTSQSNVNTSIGTEVDDIDASKVYLSVADGGGGFHIYENILGILPIGDLGQMMTPNNPSLQTRLEQVVRNVKSDEYMLVFCSFAQESFNDITKTGKTWMQAVSDACDAINISEDPTLTGKIFDGAQLNSNTLVGDVLGKVIVMINSEEEITTNTTLPSDSKCVYVHIPNQLTSDYFPQTGFKTDNLHTSSASTSTISMAVSQAQITSSTGSAISNGVRGYYPSFTQRTNVVNAILDWSKNNYGTVNYAHNRWIYLGLGGLTGGRSSSDGDSGTAVTVLNTYSPLISSRIDAMGVNNVPYYPVGIVYLNYTVSGSNSDSNDASETVKKILLLNNKYRLQYDSTKPEDYMPK
ncbi:MAG: hypothetical protein J6Q37_03205 [Bacteroidales bacterium]|nr:hypothetical protein [Bacteroidales bacterium]